MHARYSTHIEPSAANGAVLFDHNADGIKTGTGWAAPNDGLLVRDLNGNGVIDSGRELFGIDTLKANNTFATQGFDALKELDSNADGFITSADTAFSQLKVWQDLNQDGISQTGELKTLNQWGITSIRANGSTSGPQAGQVIAGNRVDLSATFTQAGANYSQYTNRNAPISIAACANILWGSGRFGREFGRCKHRASSADIGSASPDRMHDVARAFPTPKRWVRQLSSSVVSHVPSGTPASPARQLQI